VEPVRIPIAMSAVARPLLLLTLAPASTCWVEVRDDELEVRMAWQFKAVIPRRSIVEAVADTDRITGWGVHGGGGAWLVSGSSKGLVRIRCTPPARARAIVAPVQLELLRVSVAEPDRLLALLQRAAG